MTPKVLTGEHRDARVLVAALRVWVRDGRLTTRAVMVEAGIARYGDAHAALGRLRQVGLIDWDDGHRGSMRPTCAVVVLR